jgi:ribosomal-protein-alanine N-acetyltransferase
VNIQVLPVVLADVESILQIEKQSFSHPWLREHFENDLPRKTVAYLKAVQDNNIVGFIGYETIGDQTDILNLAVHPDYRRRGIAERLLSAMFENTKLTKRYILEVRASSRPAREFYRKHAFKEIFIRTDYYIAPIENAVVMEKKQ